MKQHIPCKTLNVVTIDTAETILPSKSKSCGLCYPQSRRGKTQHGGDHRSWKLSSALNWEGTDLWWWEPTMKVRGEFFRIFPIDRGCLHPTIGRKFSRIEWRILTKVLQLHFRQQITYIVIGHHSVIWDIYLLDNKTLHLHVFSSEFGVFFGDLFSSNYILVRLGDCKPWSGTVSARLVCQLMFQIQPKMSLEMSANQFLKLLA